MEADGVVENALKQRNQTDVVPNKLGEVLANVHIALVKKTLQAFVVEGRRHSIECHGSGLLLHPRIDANTKIKVYSVDVSQSVQSYLHQCRCMAKFHNCL